MAGKDLGSRYQVVGRGHSERLTKGEKRSTWTVTLRNSDGHTHSITSSNPNLWEQYPWGDEMELGVVKDKQQKLAVQQVRDKAESKEDGSEDAEEEEKWK